MLMPSRARGSPRVITCIRWRVKLKPKKCNAMQHGQRKSRRQFKKGSILHAWVVEGNVEGELEHVTCDHTAFCPLSLTQNLGSTCRFKESPSKPRPRSHVQTGSLTSKKESKSKTTNPNLNLPGYQKTHIKKQRDTTAAVMR